MLKPKSRAVKPAPFVAVFLLILMPLGHHPDELGGSARVLGLFLGRYYVNTTWADTATAAPSRYCIMQGPAFGDDALRNSTLRILMNP